MMPKPQPIRAIPNPAGRVLPHHPDAEAAVLSAVLIDPRVLERLHELEPKHFFGETNQRVWEACVAVAAEGRAVDLVSVAAWLRDRERLRQCGGPAYLAEIVDATPAIAHVEEHAALVLDAWRRRQLIAICQRAQAEGYGDVGTTAEWLDAVEAQVGELVRSAGSSSKPEPASKVLEAQYAEMVANAEAEQRGARIPRAVTGLRDLDAFTGGFKPKQLIVIAARPGMGKSSLAAHVATATAEAGLGVLVLTLEMDRGEVMTRMTAQRTELPERRLSQGALHEGEWSRVAQVATELAKLPLWIDDLPAMPLAHVKSQARWAAGQCARRGIPLGAVIVDHVGLVNAGLGEKATRNEQLGHVTRTLKALAKELQTTVVALSQLNRALEGRNVKDKRPQLADLRDSGSVEEDADQVHMLYREGYYDPSSPRANEAEVLTRKGRGIGTAKTVVRWEGDCCRFSDERRGWEPRS